MQALRNASRDGVPSVMGVVNEIRWIGKNLYFLEGSKN